MPHIDPHRDIAEREEEDEREAIAVAIEKFNAQRRHSLEVRMLFRSHLGLHRQLSNG